MSAKAALVITSIAAPNEALKKYAHLAKANNIGFILIGDTKSPADFSLNGCDFWSIERQKNSQSDLAGQLPVKHYSRKNFGYLQAIKQGAEIIVETDDDNLPYENFLNFFSENLTAECVENTGWHNVYNHFTDKKIWPRGFPLEKVLINNKRAATISKSVSCPIQQGLANDNPDVDAVYRLTYPLPIQFEKNKKIALGKNTWCPFNSQNTVWYKQAFPLLYLPSYCSFRMTDIWRSFVAQRIAWENNWNILFYSPTVWQERNEHNLMKDFEDEISGYLNNDKISKALALLELKQGPQYLGDNLMKCYSKLIEMNLINEKEIKLLELWLKEIE